MTKKIAISVPDDVAERLAREPNVSAYITEAVRRNMVAERVHEMQRQAGMDVREEKIAEARERLVKAREAWTPELHAKWLALFGEMNRVRAGGESRA